MSIYHWKLNDICIAKICTKYSAKVTIVKNEDGIFFDYKVLGFTENKDHGLNVTEELCYYVETTRTKYRFWLPYTALSLAERTRPFYGVDKPLPLNSANEHNESKKKNFKDDDTQPLSVEPQTGIEPCLNNEYENPLTTLRRKMNNSNEVKEFIRRHMETHFDESCKSVLRHKTKNTYDSTNAIGVSSEDKEMVIHGKEKESDNYLRHCWRYNYIRRPKIYCYEYCNEEEKRLNNNFLSPSSIYAFITVHTPWCLVCGKREEEEGLYGCLDCPSSYHDVCRKAWRTTMMHRKNPLKKTTNSTTVVEKILSSTRVVSTTAEKEHDWSTDICPSCICGPKLGYGDVVWHKICNRPWWPARVLPPGDTPTWLLAHSHKSHYLPLKYYGDKKYSWANPSRMCLFLPCHTYGADGNALEDTLWQALLDAADDYVAIYLK